MSAAVERTLVLPDLAATRALGRALARLVRVGDVIALSGPLGAGKTELARAVLRALGHAGEVPSPTFTLVQVYDLTSLQVWHVDLYRLERPEEAIELGLEDAFAGAATLIEWPERLGATLPDERLDLALGFGRGEAERVARLVGRGAWSDRIAELRAGV